MATHMIDRIVDANGNEFVFSDSSKAEAGKASPLMDGTASVGISTKYAREDHVHPSDTSKEDIANKTTVVLGTSDSKYPTDKAVADFVNSSIATNTANYISNNGEPFTSVEQLNAYSGTVTNNDYAFVTGTDSEGNTYYDRYKATVSGSTVTWALEYRLNNSSFTAAQWSAINSGITSVLVAKIHDHSNKDVLDGITSDKVTSWDGKEDSFDVLPTTKGGTGTNAASQSALTSSLINSLSTESSTPVDADYYVAQYTNGGTSNTSFVRKPVSSLWTYIKSKISSVLGLTDSAYSGKAATAGTADKAIADNSGNDIETTYATKTELNAKQNNLTAGDNITIDGSTISSDQVFVATYGTTKYSEVKAAYDAGKICTARNGNLYYYLTQILDDSIKFVAPIPNPNIATVILDSNNRWSSYSPWLQTRLTFDDAPTAGSTNPVRSDGIKTALDLKASTSVATTDANGLMSKTDKSKLDGISSGANKADVSYANSKLTKTIDGTSSDVFAASEIITDTNTFGNFAAVTDVNVDGTIYHTYWKTAPTSSNNVFGFAAHPTIGVLFRIQNNKGRYYATRYDNNTTYIFDGTYDSSTNKAATVSSITSRIDTAKTELTAAIDSEASARESADTTLQTNINTVDAKGIVINEIAGENVICFE